MKGTDTRQIRLIVMSALLLIGSAVAVKAVPADAGTASGAALRAEVQNVGPRSPGEILLTDPFVSQPVAPADTRGMPPAPPLAPYSGAEPAESRPLRPLPGLQRTAAAPAPYDPAAQLAPGPSYMPAPLVNFEGIGATGVLPPDTDGQVGPNHYVQIVNAPTVGAQVRVFSKTGTQLYDFGLGYLWPSGDPCRSYAYGDPVVLYDQLADRWLLTQFGLPDPPYYECIAVSKTGTPTNNPNDWHLYSFLVHQTKMNDYPKLGVWPDGYYMSANQFTATWAGAGVWVFDRDEMLDGDPATFQYFDLYPVNSNYGGLLPSNLMGDTLPPAGAPNYYMAVDMNWSGSNDILHIFEFHTDWNTPSNSTFGLVADLVVAPFDWNFDGSGGPRGNWDIPQPDTNVELDSISDRLMMHLWYRNFGTHESFVVNHTVDVGGTPDHAGVRWYEIRGGTVNTTLADAVIYQQGTYAPDAEHRWMGSVAMDRQGNMALGYSVSSSTVYPSIRYAGRLAGDAPGTLPQAEEEIIAGSGSQLHSHARWGDYSAMSVDPVDDCTFWYTQEYIETTGNAPWQTRIAAFQFPGCVKDYTLDVSPPEREVAQTGVAAYSVALDWTTGDPEEVTLSLGGLPADTQASLEPASGTPPYVATLLVTTSATTPLGTYTLVVSGTAETAPTRTDQALLTVHPRPSLAIAKSAAAEQVEMGTVLEYAIAVDNQGGPATGLVISDTLPENTEFAWADMGGVVSDDEVIWSELSLPAGEALTVTYGVTVSCVPSGTAIVNEDYLVYAQEWPTPTWGAPVASTATSFGATADFTFPTPVIRNHPVLFTNLSHNATAFHWDFDDGSFSTALNPSHAFSQIGPYTVTLTASNFCYRDVVASHPLTVEDYALALEPTADSIGADPAESVIYTLHVTNTGTLEDVYQVTIAGDDWPTVPSTESISLLPGEGTTMEVQVTVPAGAQAGVQDQATVTLRSHSDPRTQPAAAVSILTTVANAVYSVELGPAESSLGALPGETVKYTLEVINTSNTLDTLTFSRVNSGWPTSFSVTSMAIAPGGIRHFDVSVTVPLTATVKQQDLALIQAVGSGNPAQVWLITTNTQPGIFLPVVLRGFSYGG